MTEQQRAALIEAHEYILNAFATYEGMLYRAVEGYVPFAEQREPFYHSSAYRALCVAFDAIDREFAETCIVTKD